MARRLAPVLAALVPLVAASAVEADVRTKPDQGGSRGGGAALDVARVSAAGNANGLVVTAVMRGNFERSVGRGKLTRAGAALVLRPKSRRAGPAILATTGPSRRPTNLLRTRSRRVGVARLGRRVVFAIAGSGLAGVRRIEVKTFKRLAPSGRRARQSKDVRITEEQADLLLGNTDGDIATTGVPSGDESCSELRETARGAIEAADNIRKAFNPNLPPERLASLRNAGAAVSDLARRALVALARKCGTGLNAFCSGYRHVSADTSKVSATFEFEQAFGSALNLGDFTMDYFNPSTGQYEPYVLEQQGDEKRLVKIGDSQIRAVWDIHRAGRYRITAVLRLQDPANPRNVGYEERASIEVDVLPPQAGPTGGTCPPDP